ncbi:MAG: hypothetical protein ABJH63_20745 [Rhizobiaceae bacterium]
MRLVLASKFAALFVVAIALMAQSALAQTLPPKSLYQAMLNGNKASGWVAFRNFNGQQLLYFTTLQTLHCRLKEIRYSINSDALDQRVEPVKCNKALPFSINDDDVTGGRVYKSMPLGTAQWVAVQVVWEDDEESEIHRVKVCEDVGESSCGIVE